MIKNYLPPNPSLPRRGYGISSPCQGEVRWGEFICEPVIFSGYAFISKTKG